MARCEHDFVTTTFCPNCGQRIEREPILKLRNHIIDVIKQIDMDESYHKHLHKQSANHKREKWLGFLTALDGLLAHSDNTIGGVSDKNPTG